MNKRTSILIIVGFTLLVLLFFIFKTKKIRDLADVMSEGRLSVLVESGVHGFTRDSTKVYGFQYELIKKFTDSLGVELVLINLENKIDCLSELESGECDVLVSLRPIIVDSTSNIISLAPILSTRLMLVQHKADSSKLIENQYELNEDTITVLEESPYINRLMYLSDEVAINYTINMVSNNNLDELIRLVNEGKIKYTVCPEYLSESFKKRYQNVDFSMPLSMKYDFSWCVNKNSPELRERMNQFINDIVNTSDFKLLFNKYFD
ncbi:hypothetical protein MASR2M117_13080 [Paludibacter sp.]